MNFPVDIISNIDSFYNPYKKIYKMVLLDIYNPYKVVYNKIIDELSNKTALSIMKSKNRYLKIKEYIGIKGSDKIHILYSLRPINGSCQLRSSLKILDKVTGVIENISSDKWVGDSSRTNTIINVYNDAVYL
jgi:hypothetical protein